MAYEYPGIGFQNALLFQSETGNIRRFERPKSLVNYAGLASKVNQSGSSIRYGHINKQSNGFIRWAAIQSARVAVRARQPNRFQRIYRKLRKRKGDRIAVVAVTRHIMESIYWVLTKQENYKESDSRTVYRAS